MPTRPWNPIIRYFLSRSVNIKCNCSLIHELLDEMILYFYYHRTQEKKESKAYYKQIIPAKENNHK